MSDFYELFMVLGVVAVLVVSWWLIVIAFCLMANSLVTAVDSWATRRAERKIRAAIWEDRVRREAHRAIMCDPFILLLETAARKVVVNEGGELLG